MLVGTWFRLGNSKWILYIFIPCMLVLISGADVDFCTSSKEDCSMRENPDHVKQQCTFIDELKTFDVDLQIKTLEEISASFKVKPGGSWRPLVCTPLQSVAILIPYRDRWSDLMIFLNNIHRFIQAQGHVAYRIFVIDQVDTEHFNRGALFNAGYIESQTFGEFDCYILHDVDKTPEILANSYSCTTSPKVLISQKRNSDQSEHKRYPHQPYFGGVVAISAVQYQLLNGFSNRFWGWGSEDDDLRDRVLFYDMVPEVADPSVGKYVEIYHPIGYVNKNRHDIRESGRGRYAEDGVTSLKYEVTSIHEDLTYTHIRVKLQHS